MFRIASEARTASSVRIVSVPWLGMRFNTKSMMLLKLCPSSLAIWCRPRVGAPKTIRIIFAFSHFDSSCRSALAMLVPNLDVPMVRSNRRFCSRLVKDFFSRVTLYPQY